jgi:hypothetical protein
MADRDVPAIAQAAADEVGKIGEKYMPADEPPTADGVATLQGALVLSLGYILRRGTQGMPGRANADALQHESPTTTERGPILRSVKPLKDCRTLKSLLSCAPMITTRLIQGHTSLKLLGDAKRSSLISVVLYRSPRTTRTCKHWATKG